ncbi:MAG: HNH endonuclease [Chloroflexota bacterium]
MGRALRTLVFLIVVFVAIGIIMAYLSSQAATESTTAVTTTATIGTSARANTGGHTGPASLYPNPSLTPGDALPGVTADQVCTPGYSSSVRNVSSAEKAAVYQRYGIPNVRGRDEVDHFVSLELGGSNNVTNLWPEPYAPVPGAHQKDQVENYLHAQVCDGAMTLAQAQQAIRTDWYAVYVRIGG